MGNISYLPYLRKIWTQEERYKMAGVKERVGRAGESDLCAAVESMRKIPAVSNSQKATALLWSHWGQSGSSIRRLAFLSLVSSVTHIALKTGRLVQVGCKCSREVQASHSLKKQTKKLKLGECRASFWIGWRKRYFAMIQYL